MSGLRDAHPGRLELTVRTPPGSEWAAGGLGLVLLLAAAAAVGDDAIRAPAVAGQFYPDQAARLEAAVRAFLQDAVPQRAEPPIALVLPHAGYLFSGQIAADGYRQVSGRAFDVVVLLGPPHTVPPFQGAALHPGQGWRTPLGAASVDHALGEALVASEPAFRFDAAPHAREHSLEVQVPFVQVVAPEARILPVVVGSADPALTERLGRALGRVLVGRRALIVASSDLSHYPGYDDARAADRATLAAVASLDAAAVRRTLAAEMRRGRAGLETGACGEAAVLVALEAARVLGASHGLVLSYANSGDGALGDRERVVGYGAVALVAGAEAADTRALEPLAPPDADDSRRALDTGEQRTLLGLARAAIERFLATQTAPLVRGLPRVLRRPQGVFVTLTRRGELRGCIGHTTPDLPLGQAVGAMALQAAFNDPRFPPLQAAELGALEIAVSLLSPLERVSGPDAIVLGRDGVAIRKQGRSALFLPEVALEQRWSKEQLLDQLSLKAGLPAGAWRQGAELLTFRTVVLREGARS